MQIVAEILLINGPNLNLLGSREPDIYGADTLAQIEQRLTKQAETHGHQLSTFQSNGESDIVDRVQLAAQQEVAYAICNLGAFTHTSVAIRDALLGADLPFIEVHISNIYAREDFRHKSYFSDISQGCIVGVGTIGYELALTAIVQKLQRS